MHKYSNNLKSSSFHLTFSLVQDEGPIDMLWDNTQWLKYLNKRFTGALYPFMQLNHLPHPTTSGESGRYASPFKTLGAITFTNTSSKGYVYSVSGRVVFLTL